ncbi:MAG: VWA domain-containing protein [Chloroflexaceae bacterium]
MGHAPRQRFTRQPRARGQSLPMIGLMIAIIIGMVGLSVDVGNTFSEERRAVTAANAAVVAGMNRYIARGESTTNHNIYTSIVEALQAHGIEVTRPGAEPQPDELTLEAVYLDAQGRPISTGSPFITNDTNPVPNNVAFIQVGLRGRVDTSFARVVGRDDLPINATAHAGVCTSNSGIYPITVSNRIIEGNRFIDPENPDQNWREVDYDSPDISGRFTAMRVMVSGQTIPGNFSWLRWRNSISGAASGQRLAASLAGEGNLGEGFEEADWPTPQDRPETYPEQPGVLNVGDWVWGSTGWPDSADVQAALDEHIRLGTRMVLPIYGTAGLNGDRSHFHIVRLGLFVVLDKGQTDNDRWLDMLFLGDARPQQRACLYTGVIDPNTEGVVELIGSVSIWPEYQYRPQVRRPIQYVVVLDVSGSMSADFEGRCDRTTEGAAAPAAGRLRGWWRCAEAPPNSDPPRAEVENTGPKYWWSNESERRIYIAKKAIETLVRSTNMPSNNEFTTSRPKDQMALVWYTHEAPSGYATGFSSDSNGIINTIRNAGKYRNEFYRTEGGTNTAAGLYRASLLLQNAPRTVTENGQTWEYKRVVILVTDGVSNNFFSSSASNLRAGTIPSRNNTYTEGHMCNDPRLKVLENAPCQTTDVGGLTFAVYDNSGTLLLPAGLDRPITQAVKVSREFLQANGIGVYVIALSNIPDTGLRDGIASFPSYFFSARYLQYNADGSTNVDAIMQAINTQVETGICEPRADGAWTNVIPAAHFQAVGELQYPTVGEVILTDQSTGTRHVAPIRADASRGGALSYRFERLPAGSYRVQPYLFYRHPLDPPGVGPRRYSLIYQNEETVSDIVINVAPNTTVGSFTQTIRQDLQLRLFGDVCATN